ncbi:hypothetical protein, partial [Serratia marcescens]|uniref:hypothetical protein n=1 Tax=Serratia marcescens TaxID=615 RepID=UPI0028146273
VIHQEDEDIFYSFSLLGRVYQENEFTIYDGNNATMNNIDMDKMSFFEIVDMHGCRGWSSNGRICIMLSLD